MNTSEPNHDQMKCVAIARLTTIEAKLQSIGETADRTFLLLDGDGTDANPGMRMDVDRLKGRQKDHREEHGRATVRAWALVVVLTSWLLTQIGSVGVWLIKGKG